MIGRGGPGSWAKSGFVILSGAMSGFLIRQGIGAAGRRLAVLAVVLLLAACGGDADVPASYAYTPAPGPTATPLPVVMPAAAAMTLPLPWPCQEFGGYCGAFDVGGGLLAAAWLDDRRMYLADRQGRIRLLDVANGAVETMLEGLSWPRGLTALEGRLYVSELGNTCELLRELSGEAELDSCRHSSAYKGMEFLSRVNAQILSYHIADSGALSDRQIVVDQIIATGTRHGPNGLANDGEYVYASIGHPENFDAPDSYFVAQAAAIALHGRRSDLMGTIIRFRPADTEVEIYAAGFRNIYGISMAPDGTIYGGDNDAGGLEASIKHKEELNAIVEGGFYGFPQWGTNLAPPEAGVIEPVAALQGNAPTYAHANADGVYVAYDIGRLYIVDRFDYNTWTPQQVFISHNYNTALLERQGLLYVVSLSGDIHVINPSVGPVRIRQISPYHTDGYVDEVMAKDVPSVIGSGYDVYVDDGRVVYVKSPCAPYDTDLRFFLHVFPVDLDDLTEDRKAYAFVNLDFDFYTYGWENDGVCRAVRELPGYDIAAIRTGQYVSIDGAVEELWRVEHRFRR